MLSREGSTPGKLKRAGWVIHSRPDRGSRSPRRLPSRSGHALTRTAHRLELAVHQQARHLPRATLNEAPCGSLSALRRQDRRTYPRLARGPDSPGRPHGRQERCEAESPVMYLEDGDTIVVMASKAGQPTHPAWFHNLKANPDTTIQIGAVVSEVRARVASDEERDRLWSKFVAMYPGSEFYQRNAKGRKIPIVILDPR
ncbi:MAG TPA: nitroreductase/quinone reductase family protein [Thermoleophilaceae bacterium]|nr:nitroreductase/quinone reductase family protein [Thermoleophilaceae bacterium]